MNMLDLRYLLVLLIMFSPLRMMGQTTEAFQPEAVESSEKAAQYRLLFHSGRVVVGEIVLRNEEVVIIKDAYGTKFQYPMSDIVEITEIIEQPQEQAKNVKDTHSRSMTNTKRTSLGVRVAGGVLCLGNSVGGAAAVDLRLGANNLGGKRIFLGGQVGYRALIAESKVLSVIPISAVLELPMTEFQHAPMIGAHIGYGIGVGGIRGGLNTGLAIGYRYHFLRTGAFHIGAEAEVQQLASAAQTITVEPGQDFTSSNGRTAVLVMLTLGVLF